MRAKPNVRGFTNGGGGGGGNGNGSHAGGNNGTTIEIFLSNSSSRPKSDHSSAQSYTQSQHNSTESLSKPIQNFSASGTVYFRANFRNRLPNNSASLSQGFHVNPDAKSKNTSSGSYFLRSCAKRCQFASL